MRNADAQLASCASLDPDRVEPSSASLRGEALIRGLLRALAVLFAPLRSGAVDLWLHAGL
jgi:hypothetical protein